MLTLLQNNANHYHELMVYMAKMSSLSKASMNEELDQISILDDVFHLSLELRSWWDHTPLSVRGQTSDWRSQIRPRVLTIPETLVEEGISSIRSCFYACILYLHHIMNPYYYKPQHPAVREAVREIIAIARETPEGYGLEMGLYFGLFMAGTAVFNDYEAEDLLRRKLKADTRVSIYVSFPMQP